MTLNEAIVLVGGRGSRLNASTENKPKPLVEVNGRPLLYWIIKWLKKNGIKHIVLAVAYKKEKIYDYLAKNDFGIKIECSENPPVEGGTAEAFRLAIMKLKPKGDFIAMNGDELTNMNLTEMEKAHLSYKATATLALVPLLCKFSVISFDKDSDQPTVEGHGSKVQKFEYGKIVNELPISIGVYIFNKKIVRHIPRSGSIEGTVFKKMAGTGKLVGYMLRKGEGWATVNTQKELKEAEKIIAKWGMLDKGI